MALRRFALFAAVVLSLLFVGTQFPEESFQLFAGTLITFSTGSTLIFFALIAVMSVLGFDRAANRPVQQAEAMHYRAADEDIIR
ncbi:hypothetical protein ACT6QH_03160 [Xanthobacter sp. TB0139]|uniref:hypothetical protein n=1 Tax=Xanthobacter sp. TB0139 TaxID=3459178 RepID=UPI004039C35B